MFVNSINLSVFFLAIRELILTRLVERSFLIASSKFIGKASCPSTVANRGYAISPT